MEMETTVNRKKNTKSKDNESDIMTQRDNKLLKKPRSKTSLFFYFFLISLSCIVVLAYQLLYSTYKVNTLDKLALGLGIHSNSYAVIIDAGSTGSRILAVNFYKSNIDGSLKLSDDFFLQNKPGLSSFADTPEKGGEKIKDLINNAKLFIPKEAWSKTPIALRATAGLRLLPTQKAEALLQEVRQIINSSPFLSTNDSVSIMDGKDEGLFSWFTVNFFLDSLSEVNSKSVATLDLGGGSVQITFLPKTYKRLRNHGSKFLHSVSILQNDIDLYSYSYLGLGLMAARNKIFLTENSEESTNILSSCIPSSLKNITWTYGGVTYTISGNSKNKNVFNKCVQLVKMAVEEENVDKAPELFDRDIYAFSYFYDRASDSGIIDNNDNTVHYHSVTVNDYRNAAKKYCNSNNKDEPLLCLDLTFITTLLENGYGIKSNTPIRLVDQVDGHEISWALGAAYSAVSGKM